MDPIPALGRAQPTPILAELGYAAAEIERLRRGRGDLGYFF